jgi:NAD(P)H-flavin reductase
MSQNLYQPLTGEITEIIEESPTIKSFVVIPQEDFVFKTGQFVELTLPGEGEAPFTPSSTPARTDQMEITIMNAGRITQRLHQCQPGQQVGLRGPYGHGYPIDRFVGKTVYIIGGGVGLAPIRSLFLTLIDRLDDLQGIVCRFGARTPQDFIYKDTLFGAWQNIEGVDIKLTADQANGAWDGHVGVVTSIMDPRDVKLRQSVAVVCGPPIMMKYVTIKLLDFGFAEEDIYLSMEKNMSCGFGKCGHCMIGPYYVCKDGPVFTFAQMKHQRNIWD